MVLSKDTHGPIKNYKYLGRLVRGLEGNLHIKSKKLWGRHMGLCLCWWTPSMWICVHHISEHHRGPTAEEVLKSRWTE